MYLARRCRSTAALAALLAIGSLSASAASAPPANHYRGATAGGGTVEFLVHRRDGKLRNVEFTATRIRLRCDDGTTKRVSLNTVIAGFAGDRTFDRDTFSESISYYRVHGRLPVHGPATGFIFFHRDLTRAGTDDRGCTTDGGKQHWEASPPEGRG